MRRPWHQECGYGIDVKGVVSPGAGKVSVPFSCLGTAWRPVKGSRHVMAEGRLGGRTAVAGFVAGDPQAMRGA